MYTLSELVEEFLLLSNSKEQNIEGVIVFDSGIPGPCLGVTIQTHGNEPSGLAALRYFRQEQMVTKLIKGSVIFALNNIKAAESYFSALNIDDADEQISIKQAARYHDVNMNRLPVDTFELVDDSRYEIVRAQKLRPIWERFDFGLDIHTTRAVIKPMIIALGNVSAKMYRGFPVDIILRNIENIQTGRPASYFYGKSGSTPILGVEAGLHEDSTSFGMAVSFVLNLLQNLEMLEDERKNTPRSYEEYFVNGSVFFPNESYELVRKFNSFEELDAGQIIAIGDGQPIQTSATCSVILPPPGVKRTAPLSDEVLFLSEPVKTVRV